MTKLIDFLADLHELCQFTSMEKPPAKASKSELRRWIEQSSIKINDVAVRDPKAIVQFPIDSFVMFPKSDKKRITLW